MVERKGWPTNPGEPKAFSEEWWEIWSWYVEEVKKRDMAVGLSDYTIHWENSPYYMDEIEKIPGVQGTKLNSRKIVLNTGDIYSFGDTVELISVGAYKICDDSIYGASAIDLLSFSRGEDKTWSAPKIRLDYHDVKAELIGYGYFKPIFEWNWKHGMILGTDNNGRGKEPDRYGDYFRTQRFITAPGNDTPGRNSDLIKVKVNSSIAHLYQRPRVWLEGYHRFWLG